MGTPSDQRASGRMVQSTVNGLSSVTVQSLSKIHGWYEKSGRSLYPRARAGPAIMAVQAPLPAVVMLLSTGGKSSTPMVTSLDYGSVFAAGAAADAVAADPRASAPSTNAAVIRFRRCRDVADIGGSQLRRRLVADARPRLHGRVGHSALFVTRTARAPPHLRADGIVASVEAQGEQHGREDEDHARDDGEAVEVALDHGGAGHRTAQLAAAEHVGEAAAPTGVQQDEEDQRQRGEHLDDDQDDVEHSVRFSPVGPTGRPTVQSSAGSPPVLGDPRELVRLEGGAADKGAVDLGHRHELGGVPRLDAPAVLDA